MRPPDVVVFVTVPPFVAKPNLSASRGHAEHKIKGGFACALCLQDKPKGGWSDACPRDSRRFMGG